LPPIGKQKRYPAVTFTVIQAEERGTANNRKENRLEADHRSACWLAQGRH